MLEHYFVRPQTVDRIHAAWIGPAIEQYVAWLAAQGYVARNVPRRVPLLMQFGAFAQARGATSLGHLPVHVDAFVAARLGRRRRGGAAREFRGPVEQLLRLVVPSFTGTRCAPQRAPFAQ